MRFSLMTAVVCLGSVGVLFACSVSTPSNPFPVTEDAGSGTLPVGTGTSTTKPPTTPPPTGSTCEQICAKAASAGCSKQSTCVADCEKDQKSISTSCKAEVDDANTCALKSSTTFTCSSSGKANAVGCDAEAKALLACITGGGSSSGGTSTSSSSGGTPPTCGLTTGNQTCDTCLDTSCCAQSTACANEPECLAILSCFGSCNDQACATACETAHPTGSVKEKSLLSCVDGSCSSACN